MAFIKVGETAQILQEDAYPVASHLHAPMMERVLAEPGVLGQFEKMASDLKAVAPKANDFLYFSAVMMHAAEASLLNNDGSLKKDASGNGVTAAWDKNNNSWKWVCSDPNIMPYKNANNDIFPEEELKKAYKQWVGRPLCLDHQSSSVDHIRGVIVDTYYDEPKKRVIALCALDKVNYPDLARKVSTRVSHCVSMGTAVGQAICTDCGRVARVEADFCDHMRNKSCYGEINVDLKPIELSIVVNGADPNAKIKHIIAAANSLAQYADMKEKQISKLSMHEMVDPDDLSAIKKDLEGIMQRISDLEESAERVEEIEEKEESGEYPQENEEEAEADDEKIAEASLTDNMTKLAGVFSDLHNTLDKLQGNMKNLEQNGEDTMTNKKEAYFQGGGGPNEPTPGKPKYEKEDSDSIRDKEDKQMVGAKPFPDVGSVEGLYGDDEKKKRELQRLAQEKEERALRRKAAVERAKAALKTAYFNGTEEPTPGKPQYEKEDSDSIRDREDKQMTGAKPFPDVGPVDGLYGDDLKKKEMLSRAHLKGRFVKAANEDGSENKSESRWHVFADNKIILTATVNELTNGKVDTLYDSIASKEFGKKILSVVRSNDLSKAKQILKGAQALPEAAPAAAPEAAPMPEMDMGGEEPRDAGGTGDPKEELPELLTTAENTLADIRAAVEALLDDGEAGLEGFDELSEGMPTQASAKVVGLNKLSKKVSKAMLLGMKSAQHELTEQVSELKMAKHVTENREKVRPDQVKYVDDLVTEAMDDTKKVLASCHGLMKTFVKYADSTQNVEKRIKSAQFSEETRKNDPLNMDLEGGYTALPMSQEEQDEADKAEHAQEGAGYTQAPKAKPAGPTAPVAEEEEWEGLKAPETWAETLNQRQQMPPLINTSLLSDDGEDEGEMDMGELDVNLPGGVELKGLASKEARALAREKIATAAMKWHPDMEKAHPGGGETTQLDTKPTGDLAKVERLDETHARMLEVAQAPPRIRQAAEDIQKMVALGKINPEKDFDDLIANGVDKDAVAYWKQFYGQAGSEGAQFASELLKEQAKAKKAAEEETYRVKVARCYDLAHDMVRRGMLADDKATVNAQVNELLALSDKAFGSYKRFTEKQSLKKEASQMPQVGMTTGLPSVVVAAPPAAPTNIGAELDAAFAGLPLKGRLF